MGTNSVIPSTIPRITACIKSIYLMNAPRCKQRGISGNFQTYRSKLRENPLREIIHKLLIRVINICYNNVVDNIDDISDTWDKKKIGIAVLIMVLMLGGGIYLFKDSLGNYLLAQNVSKSVKGESTTQGNTQTGFG